MGNIELQEVAIFSDLQSTITAIDSWGPSNANKRYSEVLGKSMNDHLKIVD